MGFEREWDERGTRARKEKRGGGIQCEMGWLSLPIMHIIGSSTIKAGIPRGGIS